MYISKVCTAVQHTNAIRTTSFPDVAALSLSAREMQRCVTERHEGHPDQQRPGPPPCALALETEGQLLAKTFQSAVWFSTSTVFLYSFLEHREEAPETPGRALLLLKSLSTLNLWKHWAQGQAPSSHTHAWLETSSLFSLSYSLPFYFDFSIIVLETFPVNTVLLRYTVIHVTL